MAAQLAPDRLCLSAVSYTRPNSVPAPTNTPHVGLARATSASEGAARSTVKRIKREAVQERDYMGKPSAKQKDKRVQVSGI